MIRLEQISKRFGQRLAVDSLDLHVPQGHIYGLLGHNGAGKSTAIGMMLGQVWPTQGSARICGWDVTSNRQKALQKVGAIFESPAFYDYLSGYRNLEILASCTAPISRKRVLEVIEWVGLSGREKSTVRTYSHGMRARLALAQALLPSPALLILDEPSDGLDPEGIHEMRQTILRLHRELGLTIFLSSHFLNEVEQLCTRIAVLNQGKKVFEGDVAAIKSTSGWIRLSTDRFDEAVHALRSANLITGQRNGSALELCPGAASDQVVRLLVERGFSVYEVTRQEQTLENFYLSLMEGQRSAEKAANAMPPNTRGGS
jgi:ABC-2 type transport system ATP-binding protein